MTGRVTLERAAVWLAAVACGGLAWLAVTATGRPPAEWVFAGLIAVTAVPAAVVLLGRLAGLLRRQRGWS